MGALPQLAIVAGPQHAHDARPVHRAFEQNLTSFASGEKTALIQHEQSTTADSRVSYAQLNARANGLAHAMRGHMSATGAQPNADGDWIVAVCMQPAPELIALLLACWKMGAAYLPLEASFPRQRIEHIVQEARPALIVVADDAVGDNFADCEVLRFTHLEAVANQLADERNLTEAQSLTAESDEQLAIVLYTSGSTGIPKGVRLPHSILQNRLRWQLEAFPFGAGEHTTVFKTALTFVDSVAEIWAPLLSGRAVLILPKWVLRDPERLVDLLETYRIERLVLVPTLLRTMLMYLPLRGTAQGGRGLPDLRLCVCSGETLSAQLVAEFYAYFGVGGGSNAELCNFYGSTEIMGDVTYYVCARPQSQLVGGDTATDDGDNSSVPIGYPITNTILYVLDAEMQPVRVGETGELYVAGRNLAAGYVGGRDKFRFVANPLSEDPAFDRLYRTGDFASVHADGALRYAGRTDSQVKIRGHRVDLAEVERQLHFAGASDAGDDIALSIDKALVLCYRAGEIDQALVAFVQLANNGCGNGGDADSGILADDADTSLGSGEAQQVTAERIEAALANRLADYMRPQVLLVDSFPLLVNGKIDRQSLLKLYAAQSQKSTASTASNDDDEDQPDSSPQFDYSAVAPQHLTIARDLFETIAAAIGAGHRQSRRVISLAANFYQLGGNSLNSIYTVTQLRGMGYRLGIQTFITAATLGDIIVQMADGTTDDMSVLKQTSAAELTTMTDAPADENNNTNNNSVALPLDVQPLALEDREEVIAMMTHSFYEKADLERLLRPNIVYQDYADIFEQMYDTCCAQQLSFVVRDSNSQQIVGASLNTDAHCEPAVVIRSQLTLVFDFLHELQREVRQRYATTAAGQLFHAGMMGTAARLTAQENIAAMHCMETEVLRVAQAQGFAGVFTTNTSPLTQQLATHVHGYETVHGAQVNRWQTADGWRPFAGAPDEQQALVQWKRLG